MRNLPTQFYACGIWGNCADSQCLKTQFLLQFKKSLNAVMHLIFINYFYCNILSMYNFDSYIM